MLTLIFRLPQQEVARDGRVVEAQLKSLHFTIHSHLPFLPQSVYLAVAFLLLTNAPNSCIFNPVVSLGFTTHEEGVINRPKDDIRPSKLSS